MNRHDILVSELCEEIDMLKLRLESSKLEAKQWRDNFSALLDDSIRHGNHMMNLTITELLKPTANLRTGDGLK